VVTRLSLSRPIHYADPTYNAMRNPPFAALFNPMDTAIGHRPIHHPHNLLISNAMTRGAIVLHIQLHRVSLLPGHINNATPGVKDF